MRSVDRKALPIIVEMLKEINPMAYNACLRIFKAPLTDLSHLQAIYNLINIEYEHTPENSPIFLGVFYKLYAPEKLSIDTTRMNNGIRQKIAKIMGWNDPPVVNYYQQILMSYYKIPSFKKKVNDLAAEILVKIKNQNEL